MVTTIEADALRDGDPKGGQFCIDVQLAAALRGDVKRGLFFRGSEALPFSKTGGLADVLGALPRALARMGHRPIVVDGGQGL